MYLLTTRRKLHGTSMSNLNLYLKSSTKTAQRMRETLETTEIQTGTNQSWAIPRACLSLNKPH